MCVGAIRSSEKFSPTADKFVDDAHSGSVVVGVGLGSTGAGSTVAGAVLDCGGAGAGCHGSVCVSLSSLQQRCTCVSGICAKSCTSVVPPGLLC